MLSPEEKLLADERVRRTVEGIGRKGALNDRTEGLREEGEGGGEGLGHDGLVQFREGGGEGKGGLVKDDLPDGDDEGVDVDLEGEAALDLDGLGSEEFRGLITRGAAVGDETAVRFITKIDGISKVDELETAVIADHAVEGLDVLVQHKVGVELLDGVCELDAPLEFLLERSALEARLEVFVDELHHDERTRGSIEKRAGQFLGEELDLKAVSLADMKNTKDVLASMRKRGDGLFSLDRGVGSCVDFDGDGPVVARPLEDVRLATLPNQLIEKHLDMDGASATSFLGTCLSLSLSGGVSLVLDGRECGLVGVRVGANCVGGRLFVFVCVGFSC